MQNYRMTADSRQATIYSDEPSADIAADIFLQKVHNQFNVTTKEVRGGWVVVVLDVLVCDAFLINMEVAQ